MGILFEILLILALIKIFSSSYLSPETDPYFTMNDEDVLRSSYQKKINEIPYQKPKGFKRSIYSYNLNCSMMYFKVSDFELLFRRGILTENQAILLWESLLNAKTERNLEWLEYNKIKTNTNSNNNSQKVNDKKYLQYLSLLFNNNEFKYQSLYCYLGGIVFYFLTKFLFKYPKINLVVLALLLVFNILNSFYFYDKKFYFTSCICLCSFISNIYFIYLNIAILCGEKDVDCSIFYVRHFKTKVHFYMKIFICFLLLVVLTYLTSISLRFHLNYIISFFILEKIREMIKNYNNLSTSKIIQPINSWISILFGMIILIYTNGLYYLNLPFSYELNSFLFVNDMITFYYLSSLDKYVYIQRNYLAGAYIESEKVADHRDKVEIFEELKNKINIERFYGSDIVIDANFFDFTIIIFCLQFLFLGFIFGTYFFIIISFLFLHTLHKNCLLFLSIKISRIISGSILLVYLFFISNLANISFSYVNEIIALYDQKFVDALIQLIKLSFYFIVAICIYISEDFVDLFNIYNYSSYRYLFREISFPNNSRVQKVLNTVYQYSNVLTEIIDYDINVSIGKVQTVLEAINDGSSNINELYIETLLTKASTNSFCFLLVIDYLINYFTLFVLSDIFSESTNPFFYLAYLIHRLGIYFKIFLLFFEYSKTPMQKNIYVMLNMIFMERLYFFVESDYIDNIIIHFFKLSNFFFYFLVLKGNNIMNMFLLLFFWVYYNSQVDSVFGLPFMLSVIVSKIAVQICKLHQFKSLAYGIVTVICLTLFSCLNYETFRWLNIQLRYICLRFIGIDLIGHFEKFVFLGKDKKNYIEIKIIKVIKRILVQMREVWKTL